MKSFSPTKLNLIANFGGSLAVALIAFIFIPFCLKSVGPAGYGLIAFQTTLVATFALFDLGFGAAGVREMARLSTLSDGQTRMATLVLSLEVLYWSVAIALGGALAFAAPYLSTRWLSSPELGHPVIESSVRLMAVALIFQFPVALYSGCLNGLQKQVGLNFFNLAFALLRYGGAVTVLFFQSGRLESFFIWQLVVSVLNAAALRWLLWSQWQELPSRARFDFKEVRSVAHFALAMGGVGLLGLLLNQVDKLILSKILSLEAFGFYTLAWTAASVINRIGLPVFNAVYPRLTQLYAKGDLNELRTYYQKCGQAMAFFVIPVSVFLIIFAEPVLSLWLHQSQTVQAVLRPAQILFAATLFSTLFLIPYALRLASGKTALIVQANLISLILIVPAVFLFTQLIQQPAWAWFAVNLMAVFVVQAFYLKGILKGALGSWFWFSFSLPVISSTFYFGLAKMIFDLLPDLGVIYQLLVMAIFTLIGYVLVAVSMPETRAIIINFYRRPEVA